MARITRVYTDETSSYMNIGRRHLPLIAGEKLTMLMDLNSKGLCIDSPLIRGRELEEFTRKFNLLTDDERRQSLEIDTTEFISVLNQCVQCVGCRRRVERLFYQLTMSGHPTLDPLEIRQTCILSITEEKLKTPQALGTLLYRHHDVLNNLLDNKLRNKTRCLLHSLDAFRAKPFSETWREVWSAMKNNCRDELTVIETKELHEVLDNYLKKHKFCTGCRTKIEKAYKILVGEITSKEKGFVSALYANIRKCVVDQHIHVSTNKIDFLDALMRRAEPEVNGSYSKLRERHAKTLEIAQEEVLTCVGMIMYERLRRIYVSLREEERACQVLAAVGVHALCRSFDTFVEKKQGISNLELLYQEISRAEKAKELKREQKKLKKKKKKSEKKNLHRICENNSTSSIVGDNDETDVVGGVGDLATDDDEDEGHVETADEVPLPMVKTNDANDYDEEDEAVDVLCEDVELEVEAAHTAIKTNVQQQHQQVKQTKKSKKFEQQQQQHQSATKKKKKQKKNKSIANTTTRTETAVQPIQLVVSRRISCSSSSANEKCNDCLDGSSMNCPCEHDVRDSGYGSEPNSHVNSRTSSVVSSPEGSEVSCSDGLCNHDLLDDEHQHVLERSYSREEHCCGGMEKQQHQENTQQQHEPLKKQQLLPMEAFSLLQLWDDFDDYDIDDENCYIPQEVVLAYECQYEQVQQKRQQLRATLRTNFQRLCMQRGVNCH